MRVNASQILSTLVLSLLSTASTVATAQGVDSRPVDFLQ